MDRPWWSYCLAPTIPELFLVSDCVKIIVYETPVETEEELLTRVAAQEIDETPIVMTRVYQNMIRRYNVFNEVGGGYI